MFKVFSLVVKMIFFNKNSIYTTLNYKSLNIKTSIYWIFSLFSVKK